MSKALAVALACSLAVCAWAVRSRDNALEDLAGARADIAALESANRTLTHEMRAADEASAKYLFRADAVWTVSEGVAREIQEARSEEVDLDVLLPVSLTGPLCRMREDGVRALQSGTSRCADGDRGNPGSAR